MKPNLKPIEELIQAYFSTIEEVDIKQILLSIKHGKMLRSQLMITIATTPNEIDKTDEKTPNTAISKEFCALCAIVEMIHLASLLHDDVIDKADKRRSQPSINHLYGNKRAIMLGDILYALAFKQLANFDTRIIKSISNAVVELSIGEFLDSALSATFNKDRDRYLEMTYKKTSSLIEAASFCAALLSGRDGDKMQQFGKLLGISFQLVDDLLDVISDEEKLGKPAMSDYAEGKVTLPYLLLYDELNVADQDYLRSLWQKPIDEKERTWIKAAFTKADIAQKTLQYIDRFVQQAKALLTPQDRGLQEILHKCINRVY